MVASGARMKVALTRMATRSSAPTRKASVAPAAPPMVVIAVVASPHVIPPVYPVGLPSGRGERACGARFDRRSSGPSQRGDTYARDRRLHQVHVQGRRPLG